MAIVGRNTRLKVPLAGGGGPANLPWGGGVPTSARAPAGALPGGANAAMLPWAEAILPAMAPCHFKRVLKE